MGSGAGGPRSGESLQAGSLLVYKRHHDVASHSPAGTEPWQVTFSGSAKGTFSTRNGALCATLQSAGENAWDAQIGYSGLKAEPGRTYVVDYRLWSSGPSDVRIKLGTDAPPWAEYWLQNVVATREPLRVSDRFVLADQAPGTLGLGFQFAGSYARQLPLTLCIDEVSVTVAPIAL